MCERANVCANVCAMCERANVCAPTTLSELNISHFGTALGA